MVIGAGVIGLTCAVRLLETGCVACGLWSGCVPHCIAICHLTSSLFTFVLGGVLSYTRMTFTRTSHLLRLVHCGNTLHT